MVFRARHMLCMCCIAVACVSAAAADWPAWGGPSGLNAPETGPLPDSFDRRSMENIRWATPLGGVAFGTPTVSNGRIFVGTNYTVLRDDERFKDSGGGAVVCLDEATGEILWTLVSPVRTAGFPPFTHMIHQRWGVCSSPTVDGDRVYIITNGGDLLCLDVNGMADGNDGPFQDEASFMANEGADPVPIRETDGDIIWRYDIPRELSVAPHDVASGTVVVDGDVLYMSTSNGLGTKNPIQALMPDAPCFIAVNKQTGELIARERVDLSEKIFHAQWSTPFVAEAGGQRIVILGGGDGVCYAFAAIDLEVEGDPAVRDGALQLVWQYDCNPKHYRYAEDGSRIWFYMGDIRARKNPAFDPATINNNDGTFIGPNQIIATPVCYNDRIYIATGRDPTHGQGRGLLHCFDATGDGDITETGLLWRYEELGRSIATVAIHDGLVYAADLAGSLYCLDADDGTLYWKHGTEEEIWGSPLVADGRVFLNTRHSHWILKAGRALEVLFNQRGGSETSPIAANDSVYAFMRGKLHAIELGANGSSAQTAEEEPGEPATPEMLSRDVLANPELTQDDSAEDVPADDLDTQAFPLATVAITLFAGAAILVLLRRRSR